MSSLKRAVFLAAIVLIAVLCILIFRNQSLALKAQRIGDAEQRIKVLEKAVKFYPWNDLVFYELGKAYQDLGMRSLGEQGRSAVHIQNAITCFRHCLRINPVSYFGHFYLGQALLNMSFYSSSFEERAYQEFTKAAHLAGENTELLYEVGKVFLSRWAFLSRKDRDLTVEILKKVVEKRNRERNRSLFYAWEVNVEDYDLVDKIFPEDAQIYREFAEFLGQRGLSLKERHRYLAKAERLEYQEAQKLLEAGEYAFFYYRFKDAQAHFKSCLNILGRMHFYENMLSTEERIEVDEFEELQKRALLNLAKSCLEQGAAFEDVEDYLWAYLEKESNAAVLGNFESYLEGKNLDEEGSSSGFKDLDRLAFHLYLSLKEGKFRDNMRVGREILHGLGRVPEGEKGRFIEILEIVGESFQKADFIYDANDFFYKALEWDPDDLEVLVKLKKNYERLSAEPEVREMDRRIGEIVSPREMEVDCFLNRGQKYQRSLVLDGRKIHLGLHFSEEEEDWKPLITVLFNGRVVWEDYVEGNVVSFYAETRVGDNSIQIVPVNKEAELRKITYVGGP
jgi:tetratricopeptide (TPR) repeat protein